MRKYFPKIVLSGKQIFQLAKNNIHFQLKILPFRAKLKYISAKLQINARQQIKQALEEKLSKKEISFKSSKSFSTPTTSAFT